MNQSVIEYVEIPDNTEYLKESMLLKTTKG